MATEIRRLETIVEEPPGLPTKLQRDEVVDKVELATVALAGTKPALEALDQKREALALNEEFLPDRLLGFELLSQCMEKYFESRSLHFGTQFDEFKDISSPELCVARLDQEQDRPWYAAPALVKVDGCPGPLSKKADAVDDYEAVRSQLVLFETEDAFELAAFRKNQQDSKLGFISHFKKTVGSVGRSDYSEKFRFYNQSPQIAALDAIDDANPKAAFKLMKEQAVLALEGIQRSNKLETVEAHVRFEAFYQYADYIDRYYKKSPDTCLRLKYEIGKALQLDKYIFYEIRKGNGSSAIYESATPEEKVWQVLNNRSIADSLIADPSLKQVLNDKVEDLIVLLHKEGCIQEVHSLTLGRHHTPEVPTYLTADDLELEGSTQGSSFTVNGSEGALEKMDAAIHGFISDLDKDGTTLAETDFKDLTPLFEQKHSFLKRGEKVASLAEHFAGRFSSLEALNRIKQCSYTSVTEVLHSPVQMQGSVYLLSYSYTSSRVVNLQSHLDQKRLRITEHIDKLSSSLGITAGSLSLKERLSLIAEALTNPQKAMLETLEGKQLAYSKCLDTAKRRVVVEPDIIRDYFRGVLRQELDDQYVDLYGRRQEQLLVLTSGSESVEAQDVPLDLLAERDVAMEGLKDIVAKLAEPLKDHTQTLKEAEELKQTLKGNAATLEILVEKHALLVKENRDAATKAFKMELKDLEKSVNLQLYNELEKAKVAMEAASKPVSAEVLESPDQSITGPYGSVLQAELEARRAVIRISKQLDDLVKKTPAYDDLCAKYDAAFNPKEAVPEALVEEINKLKRECARIKEALQLLLALPIQEESSRIKLYAERDKAIETLEALLMKISNTKRANKYRKLLETKSASSVYAKKAEKAAIALREIDVEIADLTAKSADFVVGIYEFYQRVYDSTFEGSIASLIIEVQGALQDGFVPTATLKQLESALLELRPICFISPSLLAELEQKVAALKTQALIQAEKFLVHDKKIIAELEERTVKGIDSGRACKTVKGVCQKAFEAVSLEEMNAATDLYERRVKDLQAQLISPSGFNPQSLSEEQREAFYRSEGADISPSMQLWIDAYRRGAEISEEVIEEFKSIEREAETDSALGSSLGSSPTSSVSSLVDDCLDYEIDEAMRILEAQDYFDLGISIENLPVPSDALVPEKVEGNFFATHASNTKVAKFVVSAYHVAVETLRVEYETELSELDPALLVQEQKERETLVASLAAVQSEMVLVRVQLETYQAEQGKKADLEAILCKVNSFNQDHIDIQSKIEEIRKCKEMVIETINSSDFANEELPEEVFLELKAWILKYDQEIAALEQERNSHLAALVNQAKVHGLDFDLKLGIEKFKVVLQYNIDVLQRLEDPAGNYHKLFTQSRGIEGQLGELDKFKASSAYLGLDPGRAVDVQIFERKEKYVELADKIHERAIKVAYRIFGLDLAEDALERLKTFDKEFFQGQRSTEV